MVENRLEHLSLIDELDQQQNELLDQLDALNDRIELFLSSLTVTPVDSAPPVTKAA